MKRFYGVCLLLAVTLSLIGQGGQAFAGDVLQTGHGEASVRSTSVQSDSLSLERPDVSDQGVDAIELDHIFDIEESDSSIEDSKRGHFLLDWLREMKTFIPSNHFVFDLNSKADEYFYFDLDEDSPYILLGYYCTDDTQGKIHVTINNPESKRIYSKHGCEGVYNNRPPEDSPNDGKADHRLKGTYTVIFSNHRWHDTIRVSLLVGNDSKRNKAVDKKNVDKLTSKLEDIDNVLSVIGTEGQYNWAATKTNLNMIYSADSQLVFYTAMQIITVVLVSAGQFFYLKKLLTGK
ncbi:emp24/gp25L/p24-like protein [Cryptosporidium canis]|uniref:Emp24/gp25L/p24-like protein n=1 Tax=Cryptosporidium canis TaxID=195482 RepID=A0ABQ8P2E0_9CRYT|nr:emp24/gp25L/p24-like protein [Cryptosporidium canis]KAJ1610983.1 emp24/gp25L/p24-like protein [Cryptosporidium canis]